MGKCFLENLLRKLLNPLFRQKHAFDVEMCRSVVNPTQVLSCLHDAYKRFILSVTLQDKNG